MFNLARRFDRYHIMRLNLHWCFSIQMFTFNLKLQLFSCDLCDILASLDNQSETRFILRRIRLLCLQYILFCQIRWICSQPRIKVKHFACLLRLFFLGIFRLITLIRGLRDESSNLKTTIIAFKEPIIWICYRRVVSIFFLFFSLFWIEWWITF